MSAKYYNTKEQERREIYKKCMKHLTFLDYPTVEAVGKDFESKLQERDQEIKQLNRRLEIVEEMKNHLKGVTLDKLQVIELMEKKLSEYRKQTVVKETKKQK